MLACVRPGEETRLRLNHSRLWMPEAGLAEAYFHNAADNILAALNDDIHPGFFTVCADPGQGHGWNTTFPGLDFGQSAEALLWLGEMERVKLAWDYVRSFQREDGLVPFAIFPGVPAACMSGNLPIAAGGAVYEHWVPGNPLYTLANVTALRLADRIHRHGQDMNWLYSQSDYLARIARWLLRQVDDNGLIRGAGFYLERPLRNRYDGVNQCYSAATLREAAELFAILGRDALADACRDSGNAIAEAFRKHFWQGTQFAEYLNPEHGAIVAHGLTDSDWAAVALHIATPEQIEQLWPRLPGNPAFCYDGMPGGIAEHPDRYADWEVQGIDRHDVAAMGRVWMLQAMAAYRQGDGEELLRNLRQVAERGARDHYRYMERYFSEKTGFCGAYKIATYCEYPANFIRIFQQYFHGVQPELRGAITLAPVVPPKKLAGCGQRLQLGDRELEYTYHADGIRGSYRGKRSSRIDLRLPGRPLLSIGMGATPEFQAFRLEFSADGAQA